MYFFFQAEDGIRDLVRSRGLGDVYKRQGVGRVRALVGRRQHDHLADPWRQRVAGEHVADHDVAEAVAHEMHLRMLRADRLREFGAELLADLGDGAAIARVAEAQHLVALGPVSYTHLRAHETVLDLVCRLLLEKKKITTLNHTQP